MECWATFRGKGGYIPEIVEAKKQFVVGKRYKIIGGDNGSFRTRLIFEGIKNNWNSVLFEYDENTAPLTNSYTEKYK